jgi:regulator of protease activity HflC (stomatin/prohibitin superfamily)
VHEHAPEIAVVVFFFAFLIIYFSSNIFYSIPAGHVGVLWKRFGGGTVLDYTLSEGIHAILPRDKINIYDARLQQLAQDFDVLSSDGLTIKVNIAYGFNLNVATVPTLHRYIGQNYQTVLVAPLIGARAREVFAKNTPEEIFSERREDIQKEIKDLVEQDLRERFNPPWLHKPVTFVRMWDVLIRSIQLPPSVAAAIERKNEQLQLNEEYDYRLLREAKEAERKRIEAHGIKEFQDIITPTITDAYLRWQGIQATLELARSPNTKIVVVGSGKDGLPIILNGLDGATPDTLAAAGTGAPAKPPTEAAAPAGAETGGTTAEEKPGSATTQGTIRPPAAMPPNALPPPSAPPAAALPPSARPSTAPASSGQPAH